MFLHCKLGFIRWYISESFNFLRNTKTCQNDVHDYVYISLNVHEYKPRRSQRIYFNQNSRLHPNYSSVTLKIQGILECAFIRTSRKVYFSALGLP